MVEFSLTQMGCWVALLVSSWAVGVSEVSDELSQLEADLSALTVSLEEYIPRHVSLASGALAGPTFTSSRGRIFSHHSQTYNRLEGRSEGARGATYTIKEYGNLQNDATSTLIVFDANQPETPMEEFKAHLGSKMSILAVEVSEPVCSGHVEAAGRCGRYTDLIFHARPAARSFKCGGLSYDLSVHPNRRSGCCDQTRDNIWKNIGSTQNLYYLLQELTYKIAKFHTIFLWGHSITGALVLNLFCRDKDGAGHENPMMPYKDKVKGIYAISPALWLAPVTPPNTCDLTDQRAQMWVCDGPGDPYEKDQSVKDAIDGKEECGGVSAAPVGAELQKPVPYPADFLELTKDVANYTVGLIIQDINNNLPSRDFTDPDYV